MDLNDSINVKPSSKRIAKKESTTPSKEKIEEDEAEEESEDDGNSITYIIKTILSNDTYLFLGGGDL